ncbi:large conductance mechanosensitive channel protein MscL [Candidatus Nitrosocosmicus sp. T]
MKRYPLSNDDIKKSEQNDEVLIVKKTLAQEFFDFLKTFGVIGLALAFVVGQAASGLVTSLVNDIINPLIGLFLPSGNLDAMSAKVINISGELTEFRYGHLVSSIIDFLIIALVVFIAYKQLSRFKLVDEKTLAQKNNL